jgi:DNA polymerase III subunit delta'
MIDIGGNAVVGQHKIRGEISKILESGRIAHAYLLAGPQGVGKTAVALSLAEAVNGIENLSQLGNSKFSSKSGWFTHPDIHVFFPMPRQHSANERTQRLQLLAEDPYAIIDFANRPGIDADTDGKNRNAFYSADYFRETIRPSMMLKPNEGRKTVVVLLNIEKMPEKAANAFLKTLEEPGEDLMFILTTDNFNSLLPTIVSRCQILRCSGLTSEQIANGLMLHDGLSETEASYLARIAGGNYALTRFFDATTLKENRSDIVQFLRMAYTQDALGITTIATKWASKLGNEGHIGLFNMMERFLRDLAVYLASGNSELITNLDQIEVIKKFTASLKEARIYEMIDHLNRHRPMIYQNVNSRLIYTVIAIRFGWLMRGLDSPVPSTQPWNHLPAFEYSL